MPYTITVRTIITHSDGRGFWHDSMTWVGVDEETRLWLAGSCKTALFRLIAVPEVVEGPAYTLAYQTVVVEGDKIISDTSLVEFPRLSYESIVSFQLWAMEELREMQKLLVEKRTRPPALTKPRSRIKTLLSTLWQTLF